MPNATSLLHQRELCSFLKLELWLLINRTAALRTPDDVESFSLVISTNHWRWNWEVLFGVLYYSLFGVLFLHLAK